MGCLFQVYYVLKISMARVIDGEAQGQINYRLIEIQERIIFKFF